MKRPFFVLLIFIIISVVLLKILNSLILSIIIMAALSCLYYIIGKKKTGKINIAAVFLISVCFILYTNFIINCNYDLKEYENKKVDLYLQITSEPVEKTNYTQVYAKAYEIGYNGKNKQINQKVIVYIYDKVADELKPGQKYIMKGKILKPYGAKAKGEFDYNLYLKSKRIYSLIQVSGNNIQYIEEGSLFLFTDKIYGIKDNIAGHMQSYIPNNELDIIKGILWGDKLEDESLYNNLTLIGASHILSVSGLHVGYVFLLLTFILKRTKINIKIQTIIILLVLFIYAAMCAFSVSIIRACIMFGVIQCCKIYKKLYDPLSALSFAAVIILAINPLTLFTASFQLSFGAVGGIIFFARILNNKTGEIKPKILRNPIQIIALTICVQLATLPIVLYHFSKISLISIFANVVIIPLCGVIVISSFIGMILCFLPFMGPYFNLLTYEIKLLAYFADLFSRVNYANISLDKMFISEIVVFYILLFLLFGYFDIKNKKTIYLTSVTVFACAMYSFIKAII